MKPTAPRAAVAAIVLAGTLLASPIVSPVNAAKRPEYARKTTWAETMVTWRAAWKRAKSQPNQRETLWKQACETFPIECDWFAQDTTGKWADWFDAADTQTERALLRRVLAELGPSGKAFRARLDVLIRAKATGTDARWLALYEQACRARRAKRLAPMLAKWRKVVFTKHYNLGGSHYAYTEGQSDAQHERHFRPGGGLYLLELSATYPHAKVQPLLEDPKGVIRDPDVSYDGKRILFAWKKDLNKDDYHLYEMVAATAKIRQITSGLGVADYEGAYLPNGQIMFNSTRCVQTVDCWWTEVSNLYVCGVDGKYLRRLSFDQVHTNYPTVTADGRVLYTRWDYNDRGQLYPQPLFQMFPDGTGQTETYGNASWFPTTIAHARGIPGTQKIVAIATGHHTRQTGKLILIDPAKGRQETAGVTLVAPIQKLSGTIKVDRYGQRGEQFQYPYPISETEYIVAYDPVDKRNRTGIYFMDIDGRRELLTRDPRHPCNQPVPLAARPKPHVRPSTVDYRKKTGTYYVQDIHVGPGLKGVARGTVKKLRVVALEYRAAGIGSNANRGPAGGALVSTPVSIDNGTWDVKRVLGDATVHADGSAMFTVPARTPVYFQALDAKGRVVQSMRSWSTLQPGETFACVGCHEDKNDSPPVAKTTLAMNAGPESLKPFYGAPRGFSFIKEIQPILDKHCIRCHDGGAKPKAFSLLGRQTIDKRAKRKWSDAYLALTKRGRPNPIVNWLNVQSVPPMLPPYFAGSAKSKLPAMLEAGHNKVVLSVEEKEKIACWIDLLIPYCGDYTEANAWNDAEKAKYERYARKRLQLEQLEQKNIAEMLRDEK